MNPIKRILSGLGSSLLLTLGRETAANAVASSTDLLGATHREVGDAHSLDCNLPCNSGES